MEQDYKLDRLDWGFVTNVLISPLGIVHAKWKNFAAVVYTLI